MLSLKDYLEEKTIFDKMGHFINRTIFNRKTYQLALKDLEDKMQGQRKSNLPSVAAKVARIYSDVDDRALAEMFVDKNPEYASAIDVNVGDFDYHSRQFVGESEAPTNTTTGVANTDAQPLFKKSSFAGWPCVEVDGQTYVNCSRGKGKKPFARWKNYIEDEDLQNFVKKNYHKEKRLVMKNRDTGSMTFIK